MTVCAVCAAVFVVAQISGCGSTPPTLSSAENTSSVRPPTTATPVQEPIEPMTPAEKRSVMAEGFPVEIPVPQGRVTRAQAQGAEAWDYEIHVAASPQALHDWFASTYSGRNWTVVGEGPLSDGGSYLELKKGTAESRVDIPNGHGFERYTRTRDRGCGRPGSRYVLNAGGSITVNRMGNKARIVTVALLAAFVLPAGAWALSTLSPATMRSLVDGAAEVVALASQRDDNIPGVAITPSPVAGTLDDTYSAFDFDDVHGIRLGYNQRLDATMTAVADTDFDLWLWKPGSTTVDDKNPSAHIAQSSQTRGTSAESFYFPCSQPGTYYVDVFVDPATTPNRGAYSLQWSVAQLPAPALTVAIKPSTCSYKGSAVISGSVSLDATALAGARVLIQSRPAGSKGGWTSVNYDTAARPVSPRTRTNASGGFSYTASGITRKTEYRAIVWPSRTWGWKTGSTVVVTPHVWLTRPYAPATVTKNRAFRVYGFLKPKHMSGSRNVKITAYRAGKATGRIAKNSTYRSYTKYATTIVLHAKGRWRLVATTPADSRHLATTSSSTYVTVK